MWMWTRWLALLALSAVMPGVAPAADQVDLVLRGGLVHTLDETRRNAQAVAVKDGRIVFVGSDTEAARYEAARVLDLDGKTLLPGLTDAHGHLASLGEYLGNVQLVGTTSIDEVVARVRDAQSAVPAGRWIHGRGWDQNDWPVKRFPTWRDLAGTESHPVVLERVDGHATLVNKAVLDLIGLPPDLPDPEGGKIFRDDEGRPTGLFLDAAETLVFDHIPKLSSEAYVEVMRKAVRECNRHGLVGVHDAGVDSAMIDALAALHDAGELTLRFYGMHATGTPEERAYFRRMAKRGPVDLADGRLTLRSFKLYADGALGSRGAALIEPYQDDPGNLGLLLMVPEAMEALVAVGLRHGLQACTHAIGDRANKMVLDVYEAALGDKAQTDHRFRIEHCQVVRPEDIPRFTQLGVIPAMQPTHCTSDMYWAEDRVGGERIRGAYAWRKFIDAGCRIAGGSDFPVEGVSPLWGIYAAVTRRDHQGWPEGGWHPEERMTILEAVRSFTIDAAYARFAEAEQGTIAVGKLADFTVVDRDILTIPFEEILETHVVMTIVGGEVVYQAGRVPSRSGR